MTCLLEFQHVACVAWRFWLGALSNKGGWGQRNHEEIGAGATWKTACTNGGLFWVGPYASVRIVPIGSECSPAIKYFGNLPWESFEGLNKSSPQNKIEISKKCRSWIFDWKTGQLYWSLNRKWRFTIFFKGEMSWKFCQQVLARALSLLSLLWQGRNILIENLYDHNFLSKKYYIRPDIGNVVAELYSNGPYGRNSKFQCFEKVHLNFLYSSVLENNAIHRMVSAIVVDESHTVEERRTA